MGRIFHPALFNDIETSVYQSPEFSDLMQSIQNGKHLSVLQFNYDVRTKIKDLLFDKLMNLREVFTKEEWIDLYECVESFNVILYNHVFINVIQEKFGGIIKDLRTLQDFTGMKELPASKHTFEAMLNSGEVWDSMKHAEQRLLYTFLTAKAYDYVSLVEKKFRNGDDYNTVTCINPFEDPWYLPEPFPFHSEWYTKEKAIAYGCCFAFDYFIEGKTIEPGELINKINPPKSLLNNCFELRRNKTA
jgi:hypothetical protein